MYGGTRSTLNLTKSGGTDGERLTRRFLSTETPPQILRDAARTVSQPRLKSARPNGAVAGRRRSRGVRGGSRKGPHRRSKLCAHRRRNTDPKIGPFAQGKRPNTTQTVSSCQVHARSVTASTQKQPHTHKKTSPAKADPTATLKGREGTKTTGENQKYPGRLPPAQRAPGSGTASPRRIRAG